MSPDCALQINGLVIAQFLITFNRVDFNSLSQKPTGCFDLSSLPLSSPSGLCRRLCCLFCCPCFSLLLPSPRTVSSELLRGINPGILSVCCVNCCGGQRESESVNLTLIWPFYIYASNLFRTAGVIIICLFHRFLMVYSCLPL